MATYKKIVNQWFKGFGTLKKFLEFFALGFFVYANAGLPNIFTK